MNIDLVAVLVVTAFVLVLLVARRAEKKAFNGGHCEKCQEPWSCFDTDSTGARGYTCRRCTGSIWISSSADKVKR